VIVLVAILVKLLSRGPAFYSQLRVGLHGQVFRLYKIRTMIHNCERESGVRWATANDVRVTPIGRFLRRTYLDELPQLWNVLKGDMSLVGPRPERPEFTPILEQAISHYSRRLAVRPGMTGLAQVELPADSDIESVRRKLIYDLYYIEHMSMCLDMKLMLSTTLKILHLPLRISVKLLRIPSSHVVESVWPAIVANQPAFLCPSDPQAPYLQPEVF
jgi:lipopolysaccharide/colanic/teichoic acid biosynthesis glycosyltransferase